MWYDEAQELNMKGKRKKRRRRKLSRFRVVWWIFVWGGRPWVGKLSLTAPLLTWQLEFGSLPKNYQRSFSVISPDMFGLPVHFASVQHWNNLSQLSSYSIAKKRNRSSSYNEWQHCPDTMATQGIRLNRAHDELRPWCSLLSNVGRQAEGEQGQSWSGKVRKLSMRNETW